MVTLPQAGLVVAMVLSWSDLFFFRSIRGLLMVANNLCHVLLKTALILKLQRMIFKTVLSLFQKSRLWYGYCSV